MNNTLSGLPRLSREYNEGYTKAIKDIIDVLAYVNHDLQGRNMRMNYNWVDKTLKCCLENRDKLRDNRNGFIRTEMSESGKRDIVRWFDGMD
jgi:hypothetical protein